MNTLNPHILPLSLTRCLLHTLTIQCFLPGNFTVTTSTGTVTNSHQCRKDYHQPLAHAGKTITNQEFITI